jgi:hypothetical protein
MAKEPSARFNSPRELADALSAAVGELGADAARAIEVTGAGPRAATAPTTIAGSVTAQVPAPAAAEPPLRSPRLLVGAGIFALAASAAIGWFAVNYGSQESTAQATPVAAAPADPALSDPAQPPELLRRPAAAGFDAAPAARTGTLIVKTNIDGADVLVDGNKVGSGRVVQVSDLAPGSYVVQVERRRYEPETRSVQIVAGRPTSEAFVLARAGRSRPRGRPTQTTTPIQTTTGDNPGDTTPPPLKDKDGTINVFQRKP